MSKSVLKTFYAKICDGTLQTTKDICDADTSRLAYLLTQTRTGFQQIRNTDLVNKNIDDYKAVVLDDRHWEQFRRDKLECYFAEQVDLTPCGTGNADLTLTTMTPETFICLTMGRIEKQFPGGVENRDGAQAVTGDGTALLSSQDSEFGDQDIRDLIAAKGLILYANHRHLNLARRLNVTKLYRHAVFGGSGALITSLGLNLSGLPPEGFTTLLAPVLLALVVLAFHTRSVFTRRRHRALADQFNAATRLSCATVSKCALLRQDSLINACHVMFEITNNGKEDYWVEGRLRRWTEVNEKWCEMIFWLNGRITANANYAFSRSKLIGMTLEGLVAQARFRALLLTTGWVVALGSSALFGIAVLGFLALGQGIRLQVSAGQAIGSACALLVYTFYMGWQILRLHRLIGSEDAPDAVEELLHTDSLNKMKGAKDARLHEEVAHFMKREKLKQLYAERIRLNSGFGQDAALP